MATAAQISANRLNALSSTGPRTVEGIQASSRNAVRHGLYASLDALPLDDKRQVEEILAHFAAQFPQPDAQLPLHELALAWFRRERVRTMEAAFLDIQVQLARQTDPEAPPDRILAGILMGDCEHRNILTRLHRWDRAFTRDIERALNSLKALPKTEEIEIGETKPIPASPAAESPRNPHPDAAPPSRNAPCPCGSGLKYKRCCANLVRSRAAGHAGPAETAVGQ